MVNYPSGYNLVTTKSPEQIETFKNMFQHVSPESYTARLAKGDQGLFEEMEAPAMRQFGQLQGQIASRFSQQAPGALSSRRGSAFNNTMNTAASEFAQDLASRRQELQRQAIKDLMGMSSDLLNEEPYSFQKKGKSWWQNILGGGSGLLGGALGGLGGFLFGGPGGAALGAKSGFDIGDKFGQAFRD